MACKQKNLILSVKHRSGAVMIWGFLAASRPGHLVVTVLTVKSSIYQGSLEANERTSLASFLLNF